MRVVKGLGNSWSGVSPQKNFRMQYDAGALAQVSPQGEREVLYGGKDFTNSTNFAYETIEAGVSSIIIAKGVNEKNIYVSKRSDEYFAYKSLCFALPICLVQRGNQGAYHPVYNPDGFRCYLNEDGTVSNKIAWYEATAAKPTTTANCFDTSVYVNSSSGAISNTISTTGRSDQYISYDAIYAGQVQDLRLNANKQDPNRLMEDAIRKAVAGETRGKGRVPFTQVWSEHNTDFSVENKKLRISNLAYGSLESSSGFADLFNVGDKLYQYSSNYDKYYCYIVSSRASSTQINVYREEDPSSVSIRVREDGVAWVLCGTGRCTSEYDSLPWVDVLGTPSAINALFPQGVIGSWIPTIPDGAYKDYSLNRKSDGSSLTQVYTDDAGASWTKAARTASAVSNAFAAGVAETRVELLYYTVLSSFTELDTIRALYAGVGPIISTGHNQIANGNRLGPSLLGEVLVGSDSGTALSYTSPLHTRINPVNNELNSLRQGVTHSPLDNLAATSTAYKSICHLIEKEGLLFLQYHGRELQHNGTDWGDDSTVPIVDNESTMIDDNGNTVKTFTHTEIFPIGIADYTQTN